MMHIFHGVYRKTFIGIATCIQHVFANSVYKLPWCRYGVDPFNDTLVSVCAYGQIIEMISAAPILIR